MSMHVVAVSASPTHSFSKDVQSSITLIEGLGVEGDAHMGRTVKHRSRVKADPSQPNLRQVHLIHCELHDELAERGFRVAPGVMGENITTRGIDLLGLSAGTQMRIGISVLVEITGLRNPCFQLNEFQSGLLDAVLERAPDGEIRRKAGVMGVVRVGGCVKAGDPIVIYGAPAVHRPLDRV